MEPDDLRIRLEDIGLNSEQIEEVLPLLGIQNVEAPNDAVLSAYTGDLRARLETETDPVKRAVLAAKIISADLS